MIKIDNTKKITRATFKSFIKNNFDKLYIEKKSSFDGMTDCIQTNPNSEFTKIEKVDEGWWYPNNLGIKGVWLVLTYSMDYFSYYEDETYYGIKVSNCCGSFIVGVQK